MDILREAYYVNINHNWPFVFVKNDTDNMSIYSLDLKEVQVKTDGLKLTPSRDYSYISLNGKYSIQNTNGSQINYDHRFLWT